MDFTGIVAEYDPFHNGHAAQLAAVRAAGAQCIAVCMSSGAVQRGGVPILPESVRVRAALDAGADLVVALPAPYACATAEQFAAAGVHLLAALGCDTLAFGAETPDAAALLDTARLLDGEELNARIRQNLATGMTYAAARAAAADALHPGTGGLLRTPNNILGIEYCKAILHRHAALTPLALPRLGAAHGGGAGAHAGTPMASASFLRGLPQPDWEPFVPARAARIGVVDRIFTRIGASDDLAGGQSTFMVEMTEVAELLKHATSRSLLILDEIGRGTSTYDGMSIARAVLEWCADPKRLGAKTLFATHYHELTVLEGELPGVKNFNIAARKKKDEILFLRKIVPGGADQSYGIEVANLAGLPPKVIRRAREILAELESQDKAPKQTSAREEPQVSLTALGEEEVLATLRNTQLESLTPLQAMNLLYELKAKL